MDLSTSKSGVRSSMLSRRTAMPFEDVYALSLAIQGRFLSSPEYAGAQKVAVYAAFKNEALTDEILKRAALDGKEVYFPKVVREETRLAFFKVNGKHDLKPGSHDIPEPDGKGAETAPEAFGCIVVPGVAFDEHGARIGYGKGYYDRALSKARCPKVALAFDFQVVEGALILDPTDVRMDALVTEKRFLRFQRKENP